MVANFGIQKLLEVEKYSVNESSPFNLGNRKPNHGQSSEQDWTWRVGQSQAHPHREGTLARVWINRFESSFVICGGSSVKVSRRTY